MIFFGLITYFILPGCEHKAEKNKNLTETARNFVTDKYQIKDVSLACTKVQNNYIQCIASGFNINGEKAIKYIKCKEKGGCFLIKSNMLKNK